MKHCYTTNAINLNSYDFSENDKIVVMYSKERGLIRGIAKGCRKVKSTLGATMQTLVANKLVMNKGRNLDIISQGENINSFKEIKKDFDKLSLSMYCAEIVANFGIEEDVNSKEVFTYLYETLDCISSSNSKIESFLAVLKFQLKIMDIFGFKISLDDCSNCGNKIEDENSLKFSVTTGGVLCKNCYSHIKNSLGKTVIVNKKIIEFLSTLEKTDFNMKTKYDELVTEKICASCFNLIKEYISYHSVKKFKSCDMLSLI